jgi:hypothetical protein
MADDTSGHSGPSSADDPPPAAPDTVIAPIPPDNDVGDVGYTASGVPTFESVREKIETRYGTAQGAHELAFDTREARIVEEQYEARRKAAAERLEEIRSAMRQFADRESGNA